MNYTFYAAGFIYDPSTNQVLLPLPDASISDAIVVDLIGGPGEENEKPVDAFVRHLEIYTQIKPKKSHIEPLYDYINPDTETERHVFWINFENVKSHKYFKLENLNWINLKELHKAKIKPRTKQDLIFFQREMAAKLSSENPQETVKS